MNTSEVEVVRAGQGLQVLLRLQRCLEHASCTRVGTAVTETKSKELLVCVFKIAIELVVMMQGTKDGAWRNSQWSAEVEATKEL